MDRLGLLYEITDHYRSRFPEGNAPYQIISRMAEELGEVAVEVQRLEQAPAKVRKYGTGDVAALADELEDLLHTVLSLARYYQAEEALDRVIDRTVTAARRGTPAAGGSAAGPR